MSLWNSTEPRSGDTDNNLLSKIAQSLAEGGSGGGVASISVNGGPAQTGAVALTISDPLINFQDTNGAADASIFINSGATELFRAVGATSFIQIAAARIHRDVSNSTLSILSGTTTMDGAFLELRGDSASNPGAVTMVTKAGGDFSIKNAPLASAIASSVWVVSSIGNVTHTPVWTGATVFTGYKLNADDSGSGASLLAQFQTSSINQWTVSKAGNVVQAGNLTLGNNVVLNSDAANTLAQRNGVSAQTFRVYETFTDASNYSRSTITTQAGNHLIRTEAAGTGTLRTLQVGTGPSTGANIAGVNTILHGGQSTGSAAGGSILFQVAFSGGGAGSGVTALTTVATIAAGSSAITSNCTFTGAVIALDFFASAARFFIWTGRSSMSSPANGNILLSNNTISAFSLLQFGVSTNSGNAIGRDAVNGFTIQSAAGTATYNDASTAASGTVADRYLFGLATPTLTSTNATVTYTRASSIFIGGEPVASTNVTIGTAYALQIATGKSFFGGVAIHDAPVRLKSYTVGTLPAGVVGDLAYVTDALAPAFHATVVAGGAVVTPVFFDGTNWIVI